MFHEEKAVKKLGISGLLDISLSDLSKTGMNLQGNVSWRLSITFLGLGTSIVLITLSLMKFYMTQMDILEFAGSVESLFALLQITARFPILVYHRSTFQELLEERTNFLTDEDLDLETKTKIDNWLKYAKFAQKFIKYSLHILLLTFILKTIKGGELPLECWIPNGNLSTFWSLWTLQITFLLSVMWTIIGFDSLFVILCIDLIIQLNLLNYHLKTVDYTDERSLRSCVNNHGILLKAGKSLRKIYGAMFLTKFVSTILLICMNLYIFIEVSKSSEKATSVRIKSVWLCMHLTFQVFFYFYPASCLSQEASGLAEAVYSSKWYEYIGYSKQYLLFIIQRSRKITAMTIGGMGDVSMMTMTVIFRSALSFVTLLQTIQEK